MARGERSVPVGPCRLCGVVGPLSFEHVPPKAAYNKAPMLLQRGLEALRAHPDVVSGRRMQRGMGEYTLCEPCNNVTGSHYGGAYAEWARQGMCVLDQSGSDSVRAASFRFRPLRVLKQVICMFFSANPPSFRRTAPDLERFVRDRNCRAFNPRYKVYTFLNSGLRMKLIGATVSGSVVSGEICVLSEVTFKPFGYLLVLESDRPDPNLLNINWFADFEFGEVVQRELAIPVYEIYSKYPGDFRNRATVLSDAARSGRREEEAVPPPPEGLLETMDRMEGLMKKWNPDAGQGRDA